MKIVGLIFLVLGIGLAVKVMNSAPIPGDQAYDAGKRIGRGTAPYILMAIGLRLLLRRDPGNPQANRTAPTRVPQYPPPAAAPPAHPASMPVKIHCGCGQRYEFEVEPVAGRMPTPVACPACGADGTDAANASIAQTLALRAATPAWSPPAASRRRFHPATLIGIGAVGAVAALIALVVTVSLVRRFSFRDRPGTPPPASFRSETARPNPPPRPPAGTRTTKSPPPKAGSLRDAAPVPPEVTAVDAFWGGWWYEATILRRDGPRAFIHYEGWNSRFDEWVTADRLRPRR